MDGQAKTAKRTFDILCDVGQHPFSLDDLGAFLQNHPNTWVTAKVLSRAFPGVCRRTIAALAESSAGQIISTTHGYKLSDLASDDDIFLAYQQAIRKALGSEKRARAQIHYARTHGRLGNSTRRESEIKQQVNLELNASSSSAHDKKPDVPAGQQSFDLTPDWKDFEDDE